MLTLAVCYNKQCIFLSPLLKNETKSLPGCNTSGIERMPDALMRRFRWPYVSFIDNADA